MSSDEKISELTALAAAPATGDLLPIVDISDTTDGASGTTKKLTIANLFTSSTLVTPNIGAATGDSIAPNSSSSGFLIKNNNGVTVASIGVGSAASLNSSFTGAVAATGLITASAGITFGNETLSDYDKGTSTPTMDTTGGTPLFAYSIQALEYTRVGDRYDADIRIIVTSYSGGTGVVEIILPFTTRNTVQSRAGAVVSNGLSVGIDVSGVANSYGICGYCLGNDNAFRLYHLKNNGTSTNIDAATLSSSFTIYLTLRGIEIN